MSDGFFKHFESLISMNIHGRFYTVFGQVCDTHASSVARDEDHCLELLTFQEARFQWNFSFELIHCVRRRPRPTICFVFSIFLSQLLFGRIVMMLYVRRQSGKFFWRCNGNFMVGKEMIGNCRSTWADSLGRRGHFCLFVALGFAPLLMTKAV